MLSSNQSDFFVLSKWDIRFFSMCSLLSSWSEDQSRKVGAVIVGHANEIISAGYNGLPRGVNGEVTSRHSREADEKYYWFEHAERNAIYNAARIGVPLEGARIYVNLFPCADCCRAVIQSGLRELNTLAPPVNDFKYLRSFEVSQEMLKEAGVAVRLFDYEINCE